MSSKLSIAQTKIILDATHEGSSIKVFSITLLERNLRLLALFGVSEATVLVSAATKVKKMFRNDFGRFKPIKVVTTEVESAGDFLKTLPESEKILLIEAHSVFQESLIEKAVSATDGFIYLSTKSEIPLCVKSEVSVALLMLKERAAGSDRIPDSLSKIDISNQNIYMRNLRKTINPYAFYVQKDVDAEKAEQFLFDITHYGSIDICAKYFYKALAKFLVRWIAKTNFTPNQITYTSIAIAFSVSPLFAFGYLPWGIINAIIVSILDVCDGKLARFTYRTSEKGDLLDHVADRYNIYLYYICYGIGLKTAGLIETWPETGYLIAFVVGSHILDRIAVASFRYYHRIRIHDYSALDSYARLLLPRRNIFIYIMLVGLLVDKPVQGYFAYAVWMMVYVIFHFGRVVVEKPKKNIA